MKHRRSPFSIVLLAVVLILAAFAIIVILSAPAVGQTFKEGNHDIRSSN